MMQSELLCAAALAGYLKAVVVWSQPGNPRRAAQCLTWQYSSCVAADVQPAQCVVPAECFQKDLRALERGVIKQLVVA
jgi:hypothetical protein